MQGTITCILCGQQKPGSMEHVIPEWARKQLGITGKVTTRIGDTGNERVTDIVSVLLRRTVCVDCNGGWMSQLEEKVKPFLGPMLVSAHGVDLDAEQQRDLARWAVMKVLLLELSARQQYQRQRPNVGYEPSAAELAWLSARDEPPPRSRVWIGAFDSQNITVASSRAHPGKLEVDDEGAPIPTHLTTMTLGCVLFQVFSIDYVAADSRNGEQFYGNPPPPFSFALSRIWPIEGRTVHWPLSTVVDMAARDGLEAWPAPPSP